MFTINLKYSTGDSFHNEDTETTLKGNWTLETAKVNLKRIKEHNQACKDRNAYACCAMANKEKDFFIKITKEPWFYIDTKWKYEHAYSNLWEFSIMLLENNGENKKYHVSWTGYFEHLISGHIIANGPENGSDTEFYTNW